MAALSEEEVTGELPPVEEQGKLAFGPFIKYSTGFVLFSSSVFQVLFFKDESVCWGAWGLLGVCGMGLARAQC